MTATGASVAGEALRSITILADIDAESLAWIAGESELLALAPGEALARPGDPADAMHLVLEGRLEARREERAAGSPVYTIKAGEVGGVIPFSRMVQYPATVRAVLPSRVVRFPKAKFPDLLRRVPQLEPRLVAVLADRVRYTTQMDQQYEKLTALGKLSAGLAHELNNPAAAVRRAAVELRGRLDSLAGRTVALLSAGGGDALHALDRARIAARQASGTVPELSPLERSDREDALGALLEAAEVGDPWTAAATLAEAGLTPDHVRHLTEALPAGAASAGFAWLEDALGADALALTLERASGRISELVGAVKSFTHMDRAQVKEPVDLREGIETTLTLFAHRVRAKSIVLERDYAAGLLPVPGYAGELNQVWTNILDNAFDAVAEGGRVRIRTAPDGDCVAVELADDGPGIPAGVLERIWDPFFTTKEVGEGTGLGLDIARHIVTRRHGGRIDVTSRPGDTRFVVRLPLAAREEPDE